MNEIVEKKMNSYLSEEHEHSFSQKCIIKIERNKRSTFLHRHMLRDVCLDLCPDLFKLKGGLLGINIIILPHLRQNLTDYVMLA